MLIINKNKREMVKIKVGIDVGYLYTKSCFGMGDTSQDCDIFKSVIREDKIGLGNSIHVKIEDKEYTVGDNKGIFSGDLNKIDDEVFKVCLYTAIARAIEKSQRNNFRDDFDSIELVTGLPVGQYKSQMKKLRESLFGKEVLMRLNSELYAFTITNVAIFPQSSGVFLLENIEGDVLVIDWGSKTVDCSLFSDMQLIDFRTYSDYGMLSLYGKIIQDINDKEGVSLDKLKGEEVLKKRSVYYKDASHSYNPDPIVNTHIKEVLNLIKTDLPFDESRKIFIGGGSLDLKKYLPESYKVWEDGIYTNAKAFYEVALEKF